MKCDRCKEIVPRIYLMHDNGYWYCLKCWTTIPKIRGVINWSARERVNKKVIILNKLRR